MPNYSDQDFPNKTTIKKKKENTRYGNLKDFDLKMSIILLIAFFFVFLDLRLVDNSDLVAVSGY